jgi:hypothetical protein
VRSSGTTSVLLALTILFAAISLLAAISASAALPGYKAYAACGRTATDQPAHQCQFGERPGLFFKSPADISYDVCLTSPLSTSCALDQNATAGALYVNTTGVFVPGRYFVTWTIDEGSTVVGNWTYTISKPYWETCLGSSLPGSLRVHRASCKEGHAVIKAYTSTGPDTHGPRVVVDGFRCNAPQGLSPISCRHGKERVSYSGGA